MSLKIRSKRRKDASVLTRQKPARGRGKKGALGLWLRRLKVGAVLAAAVLVIWGGVLAKRRLDNFLGGMAGGPDPSWSVSIKMADDTPLTDTQQDDIVKTARRLLGKGGKKELTRAAAAIQQLDGYADVHVVRLGATNVAVQVHQRIPILCVEADRLRFLAVNGDVYGQAERDQCPGPVVTGLFEPQSRFTLRADFTLALEGDDRTLAREAAGLARQCKERGLVLTAMNVQRYRGFSVTLGGTGAGSAAEIALGRAPFAPKLEKLDGILQKLATKQEQAARIELDYQGKAFIKLKKM